MKFIFIPLKREKCKDLKPTEKQIKRVQKIIDHIGVKEVESYIRHFYSEVNINDLEKNEAQKIITGLQFRLPRKPWGGEPMSMSWIQSQ